MTSAQGSTFGMRSRNTGPTAQRAKMASALTPSAIAVEPTAMPLQPLYWRNNTSELNKTLKRKTVPAITKRDWPKRINTPCKKRR